MSSRYTLPKGDTQGYVTYSDGTAIWVEMTDFVQNIVAGQESEAAIVDVCVRAAHNEYCNWVRIR